MGRRDIADSVVQSPELLHAELRKQLTYRKIAPSSVVLSWSDYYKNWKSYSVVKLQFSIAESKVCVEVK